MTAMGSGGSEDAGEHTPLGSHPRGGGWPWAVPPQLIRPHAGAEEGGATGTLSRRLSLGWKGTSVLGMRVGRAPRAPAPLVPQLANKPHKQDSFGEYRKAVRTSLLIR